MATLYLVKGYLDQAATSLADAQALLTALANPSTAANSAIIDRIGGKIEDLVQSDSGEPLVISSIDDAAGTISSWVTDASYTVAVGLGDADPGSAYTYASTPALSVSGSTRTGTLGLNSTRLRDALASSYSTPPAGRRFAQPVRLWLHIRVALAGTTETVALLRVAVRAGVLSSTPVDLAADTYMTTAAANAAFQPVDSDLTAIAALTTTTFGRSLLTQADAAAARATQELAYPTASLAVAGNIAVWANSMGTTGSSTPWPYWLAIRTGRPVYNGSVAGETSTQIKTRFDAATDKRGYFTIFDVARNDSDFTVTKSNLAAMIASLGHTRYLVIGVLCRQSTPTGNAQHTLDLALNAELQALYGPRFYDSQAYLVGMYDPNVAQDVTDYGNDVFPTSLEYATDATHLNLAGHLVQADRITPQVLHLGALPPAYVADASITKSAPTLSLVNTGAGGATYALANTAAGGQFRVTETGVADRLAISKTTGNTGIGTTAPLAKLVVSNEGATGLEIDPASSGGTQVSLLAYNRSTSAYKPLVHAASAHNFTVGDATITKSAPTLYLANTGSGGNTFRLSTTAAAGDFRITEDGVADRLTILPTTGYIGIGTSLPVAPLHVSNGGGVGFEIDPTAGGGTQLNLLAYNRAGGAYAPASLSALTWAVQGPITSADQITLSSTSAGYIAGTEQSSSPAAPSANGWRLYAKDNGSGKTALFVRFASGAEQQIAIEP